jgi:Zn-dependent alcohol dehydrogenase
VDLNSSKFEMAIKLGAHDCFNPSQVGDIKAHLLSL